MNEAVAEIVARVRNLPVEDRARIVDAIIASMAGTDGDGLDAAWDEALQRRISDAESGRVSLRDAADVFADIERRMT